MNEEEGMDFGVIPPEDLQRICENLRRRNREDHIKLFGGFTVEFIDLLDGTRRILN
jgi:hypothetical protein